MALPRIRKALKSLAQHCGYLIVDHRNSPGLTPADVARMPPGTLAVPGGQLLERDTKQCTHCERGVLLHPNRVRPRGYCQKCDAYICDGCAAILAITGECVPFKARLDRAQAIAEQYIGQPDHPANNPDLVLTDLAPHAGTIAAASAAGAAVDAAIVLTDRQ